MYCRWLSVSSIKTMRQSFEKKLLRQSLVRLLWRKLWCRDSSSSFRWKWEACIISSLSIQRREPRYYSSLLHETRHSSRRVLLFFVTFLSWFLDTTPFISWVWIPLTWASWASTWNAFSRKTLGIQQIFSLESEWLEWLSFSRIHDWIQSWIRDRLQSCFYLLLTSCFQCYNSKLAICKEYISRFLKGKGYSRRKLFRLFMLEEEVAIKEIFTADLGDALWDVCCLFNLYLTSRRRLSLWE